MTQRPMLLQNSIRKKSRASKAIGLWGYGISLIIGAAINKNTGVKDACKSACCSILCQVQNIKDKLAEIQAVCCMKFFFPVWSCCHNLALDNF